MTQIFPEFELLESLLWEPHKGYFLLDEHLQRLENSAQHLNFTVSLSAVRQALETSSAGFGAFKQKVRLTISYEGKVKLKAKKLGSSILRIGSLVGIATTPIDRQIPFLYHKTTYRSPYTTALASQPQCQDVFLWNEDGFVTESTIANIVIRDLTNLITPPVHCGLLPGTFRAKLLTQGKITEKMIALSDLRNTDSIFLINSVRGWIELKKEAQDLWKVVSLGSDVAILE